MDHEQTQSPQRDPQGLEWIARQFQGLHKLSPLGRSSTVQDVVATVRFALENQSITGTTLLIDGGQHLMRFERDFSLM